MRSRLSDGTPDRHRQRLPLLEGAPIQRYWRVAGYAAEADAASGKGSGADASWLRVDGDFRSGEPEAGLKREIRQAGGRDFGGHMYDLARSWGFRDVVRGRQPTKAVFWREGCAAWRRTAGRGFLDSQGKRGPERSGQGKAVDFTCWLARPAAVP